ncbi:flippase activity-associated protein Agl23 [Halogeometricum sp. CBA1124]|uniref:flippase activity-associated protein Agl23 n=1 Tax=Halogeometricum sp. CBA1124 TaxID=2668071 RepID=UPI0031B70003
MGRGPRRLLDAPLPRDGRVRVSPRRRRPPAVPPRPSRLRRPRRSDATARLPVAVLGAALPSCALLFRDRLDDAETLAFAAVLAFHPLLVYYSRFLRGDVPLVLFALAFVGFVVRAFDRASRRDAYAAAVALALAFASSGFAAAYVLCWVAVGVLLVDQPSAVVDGGASARRLLASLRSRVAGRTAPAARASLLFLGTTVLMFAPRAGPHVEVGLTRPTTWHLVLYESTVGALWSFVGVRVVNRWPAWTHELFPYVADLLGTLGGVALPTAVAAVAVFAWNRYVAAERRTLLDAFAYWAAAAVAVFPVVTEVAAPWVAIHVLLPLAPLAAVGAAASSDTPSPSRAETAATPPPSPASASSSSPSSRRRAPSPPRALRPLGPDERTRAVRSAERRPRPPLRERLDRRRRRPHHARGAVRRRALLHGVGPRQRVPAGGSELGEQAAAPVVLRTRRRRRDKHEERDDVRRTRGESLDAPDGRRGPVAVRRRRRQTRRRLRGDDVPPRSLGPRGGRVRAPVSDAGTKG